MVSLRADLISASLSLTLFYPWTPANFCWCGTRRISDQQLWTTLRSAAETSSYDGRRIPDITIGLDPYLGALVGDAFWIFVFVGVK